MASASTTEPTNQDVTVTAVFSSDSAMKQYSTNGTNWSSYTGGIVMSGNGTVYFRGIDAVGNISEVTSYRVANINKVVPDAPVATADITAATRSNVTVTATFSGDAAIRQYSLDGLNWSDYQSGIVFEDNGEVFFRGVSASGTMSNVTVYAVTNIDKVAPSKPTASASTTEPTNQDVTVTAVFSDDSATKQYSTDGTTWNT